MCYMWDWHPAGWGIIPDHISGTTGVMDYMGINSPSVLRVKPPLSMIVFRLYFHYILDVMMTNYIYIFPLKLCS